MRNRVKNEPESDASSYSQSDSDPDSEEEAAEEEEVEQPRRKRWRRTDGCSNNGERNTNPGRRIIGGRLYDSVMGVSCHWCRQKTVEDHVRCTRSGCTVRFCGGCLANRHGEDVREEEDAGVWVCPKCRGGGKGCGDGCKGCCNCGPCRISRNQKPTGQIMMGARKHGFYNAHDWLIHLETGESAEEIASRKNGMKWTKGDGTAEWVKVKFRNYEAHTPRDKSSFAEEAPSSYGNRMRGAVKNLTESSPQLLASQRVTRSSRRANLEKAFDACAQVQAVKSEWDDTETEATNKPKMVHEEVVKKEPAEDESEHYNSADDVCVSHKAPESFKDLLQKELDRPFDAQELASLKQDAELRKGKQRMIQTRHQVHVVNTKSEGKSMFDYYPDFRDAVESADSSAHKLRLLRGFCLWLKCGVLDANGFKPWITRSSYANGDECCEVDGLDCEITQEVVPLETKRLPRITGKVKVEMEKETCSKLKFPVRVKSEPVW